MTGSRLASAGALMIALGLAFYPALAAVSPFRAMAGSWSGGGMLSTADGNQERLRCRASYDVAGRGDELSLNLRCASDSYNFDLTGQFAADGSNHISGQWTERTRNIGGNAIGTARGDQIQVHVESGAFAADLSLTTRGRRQSVTINSPGGGQPMKANITLSRR